MISKRPAISSTLLTFIYLGILLSNCKKNTPHSSNTQSNTVNVYVFGQANDTNRYWKNGLPTSVLGLALTGLGPRTMAVSGNDVYIAGTVVTGIGQFSAYWKDSSTFNLQDSQLQSNGNSIFVSGSDIYVGGTGNYPFGLDSLYTNPAGNYPITGQVATCWKNDAASVFPGDGVLQVYNGYANYIYDDYISSLFVSGTDVYMAGGSSEFQIGYPASYQFAKYWKNGVPVNLTGGLLDSIYSGGQYYITSYPYTNDIYVSGKDVYVAGNEYNTNTGPQEALYWKNGSVTYLSISGSVTYANAIFVSGTDVYVAGNMKGADGIYHAIYWKNSVPTTLSVASGGSTGNAIFVYGNDVYVAGFENINGNSYATYWKNGLVNHLLPANLVAGGSAISIYVEASNSGSAYP